MIKESEKFIAFVLLGGGLLAIALVVYLEPLNDTTTNSSAIQIINTIVGALTLAFGGAANALFRIREAEERKVTVENPVTDPVHVEAQ